MGGEKRAPRRPLSSFRRGLDALFPQNTCDGAPSYGMAEIREGTPRILIYPHRGFSFARRRTSSVLSTITQGRPSCFRRVL